MIENEAIAALEDADYDDEYAMFTFARALRGWRWTPPATGATAAAYIERSFRASGGEGEDDDAAWESLGLNGTGDGRAAFIDAWTKVRVPEGHTMLSWALECARVEPFIPAVPYSQKYVLFVSVAGHLHRLRQRAAPHILLPVERLASLLKVSKSCVSIYRRWAAEAGILRPMGAAAADIHLATRFEFCVDQFDAGRRQHMTRANEDAVHRKNSAKAAGGRARAVQATRSPLGRFTAPGPAAGQHPAATSGSSKTGTRVSSGSPQAQP